MPDAEKREKVIRGLKLCAYDPDPGQELKEVRSCPECPYYRAGCSPQLIRDALDLLKEQEPRALEYSEIEKHPLVWLEDNDKEDVIPALFLQYNGWNAEFAVQAPDEDVDTIIRSPIVSAVEGMYGITWRVWTSHPLEKMRNEVSWDD